MYQDTCRHRCQQREAEAPHLQPWIRELHDKRSPALLSTHSQRWATRPALSYQSLPLTRREEPVPFRLFASARHVLVGLKSTPVANQFSRPRL